AMETSSQLLLTFLLNACWQIALIAAVAAFCDWLLRQATARHRHWLWVAALVLSLCLPALTILRLLDNSSGEYPRLRTIAKQAVAVPILLSQETALDEATTPPAPVPFPQKGTGALIPINRSLASMLVGLYFLF